MEKAENKDVLIQEIILSEEAQTKEFINESVDNLEEKVATSNNEIIVSISEKVVSEASDKLEQNENAQAEDKLVSITNSILELTDKMNQMNQLFVQKIAHITHEEKIVDQMHTELQKYKEDMYAQLVRPILLDIIEVRDSILRISANFAAKSEDEQSIPLKTFSGYAYDIQDILERNNITIYDSKEGDVFSPIKQRAIKKITTSVEDLHGKIAESLSSGYEYLGKTISPEKVVVYVYQKTKNEEGESNNG